VLYSIPKIINMRIILPPIIVPWGDPTVNPLITKFEAWGYTGFVVIAESHASFHTWPDHRDRKCNLDIFSCKDFDHEHIIENLQVMFHARKRYVQVLERK